MVAFIGSHQPPGVTELLLWVRLREADGQSRPALFLGTHAVAGETGRFSQEPGQGMHSPVRGSGLGLDRKVSVPCDRQDDVEAVGWKRCLPSRSHVCTHTCTHTCTHNTRMYTHIHVHGVSWDAVWSGRCAVSSSAGFSAQMTTRTRVPLSLQPQSLRSRCLRCRPPVPRP